MLQSYQRYFYQPLPEAMDNTIQAWIKIIKETFNHPAGKIFEEISWRELLEEIISDFNELQQGLKLIFVDEEDAIVIPRDTEALDDKTQWQVIHALYKLISHKVQERRLLAEAMSNLTARNRCFVFQGEISQIKNAYMLANPYLNFRAKIASAKSCQHYKPIATHPASYPASQTPTDKHLALQSPETSPWPEAQQTIARNPLWKRIIAMILYPLYAISNLISWLKRAFLRQTASSKPNPVASSNHTIKQAHRPVFIAEKPAKKLLITAYLKKPRYATLLAKMSALNHFNSLASFATDTSAHSLSPTHSAGNSTHYHLKKRPS